MTITEAQAIDQIQYVAKALNERDLYLSGNSEKLIDHLEDIADNVRGDSADEILTWQKDFRRSAQEGLSPADVQKAFSGPLKDFARSINKQPGSFAENFLIFHDRLVEQSETVNSNGPTYGSVSAGGGNNGDGVLLRLTVDENDNNLHGNSQEAKTAYVLSDENQNNEFRERFGILGVANPDDFVQVNGSGLKKANPVLTGRSVKDTQRFVSNPNWNGPSASAGSPATPSSTTAITDWTLSSASNFRVDVDTVFRGIAGGTTPRSLRFMDNGNINQVLNASRANTLPQNIPLIRGIAVYRESSCDGTFTMEFGADSKAVSVSGLTNGAWNRIWMDFDQNCYYKRYKENDLNLKLTLASRLTGTIYVSDLIVAPWQLVDGLYYNPVGGATSWLKEDTFSWTDSETARAILLYWLVYRSGIQGLLGRAITLPSNNAGGETHADPT